MATGSVLVLDSVPQTLAVVRSLGRAGHHVVLGRDGPAPDAQFSRYCGEIWRHPDPADLDGFRVALCELLESRRDITALFPAGERGAGMLLAVRAALPRPVDLAMVPETVFATCRDKVRANDAAQRAGLAVPPWRVVDDLPALQEGIAALGLPVIVKPLGSQARLLGRKAWVISTEAALAAAFVRWPEGHPRLLVQRFVAGTLAASDFVAQGGILVGYCEAHSVRTDMADGTGFGVEFETVPPSPDLLAATRAFAAALDYSGPGLIQFIRCADTGALYFLENNPRLSAGVADSIACGQDMPLLTLEATAREAAPLPPFAEGSDPYAVHHHAYWLQRDLEGWIRQRHGLSPGEHLARLRSVAQSLRRADSHIVWQWRDPMPCLHSYTRFGRRLAGRLGRAPAG